MVLLIASIFIFIILFVVQISFLVKSLNTNDNRNWLSLFSSIGGSILSVILFFVYMLNGGGDWSLSSALFFIFWCAGVMLGYFIILLASVIFKIAEIHKFKKEEITRSKIERDLVKKMLTTPFLIIVLLSIGVISIDFILYNIEVHSQKASYSQTKKEELQTKREELQKMVDFVNKKYITNFKVDDCIYYREEDYSRHQDLFGNGKTYNIPYLAIFEKGMKKITVADRKGKLSDDGQLEELNSYIGNYFSKKVGEKIDFVQVRKTYNGNIDDDTINFVIQEKFGDKITEKNIDDFINIIFDQEDLELLFYIKSSVNMEELIHEVTNKLNYLKKYNNIERLMIYFYDNEEELIINKIQKIQEYGEHQYTEAVSSDDYDDDYKFDYYYIPNNFEYYYPDDDASRFKNEKFNTFIASAFCVLDRGYNAGQGNREFEITNNWEVYTYK
ncbi:MAG: hypothetical protein K2N51_19295 [Lachnospiraceae bacterium]|nr:hypothetical protein [Lachnospiraceae bacterium]